MITIHVANTGVPVSRENLHTLAALGMIHYSTERLRFEVTTSRVTKYVLETFLTQVGTS